MRHIHTSIVSRHLATRGNNKILRTPPPHISSSEERLPHLTRRTLAQLITNKSPFLKSYLHKVDAKSHPSPLCPLCNTHTHHTVTPGFVDSPCWSDGVAGQMESYAGWWTKSGMSGHTHQHIHCQHNFYKHHTDGRRAHHSKGQDAQQLHALTRPHSMQNHTEKQHYERKHL